MKEQLLRMQCEQFADEGYSFSLDLYNDNQTFKTNLIQDHEYFSISLAIALTWTKHAKYELGFIKYASEFIESDADIEQSEIENYSLRFGHSTLAEAMNGLRIYRNSVKDIVPDISSCDAKELIIFQNKGLRVLESLIADNQISGVGPWLFLGPFKIILGTEKRLWEDPNIDTIILPTGFEVRRGIHKLISNQSLLVKDFDLNWITNEEGTLLEGYGNDELIQNVFKKIAELGNTRVIHINSAFYLYGQTKDY